MARNVTARTGNALLSKKIKIIKQKSKLLRQENRIPKQGMKMPEKKDELTLREFQSLCSDIKLFYKYWRE